ncbi:hypothetical protein SAMN04487866_12225 [Thermoactinomyces sp. DSM 45891]|uniref:hypothetical protein n=1 Tax=Thermoactinomyces sp. DSM 45891 TaxID=1761907 RepID=UPI000918F180|nr:hypothetical protein [Thermoactinomyces sp. DSM 45891]SFX74949.1 hypothetical protein SAMN04487866_12225 [Thermoactinomyces sp. DSM 45891]
MSILSGFHHCCLCHKSEIEQGETLFSSRFLDQGMVRYWMSPTMKDYYFCDECLDGAKGSSRSEQAENLARMNERKLRVFVDYEDYGDYEDDEV